MVHKSCVLKENLQWIWLQLNMKTLILKNSKEKLKLGKLIHGPANDAFDSTVFYWHY